MCDSSVDSRCLIPPSPELKERMERELTELSAQLGDFGVKLKVETEPDRPGLNDGLIRPGDYFPLGTPLERVRAAAAERAPLRGPTRIVAVMVEFPDRRFGEAYDRAHFEELFFSRGVLRDGSVREYFTEASRGLVDIVGEVVGPYMLPHPLTYYANGSSGTGSSTPNARTMARHAAELANPQVNFAPYDNGGDGFVDAFIVVHAGSGAEQTGSSGDIWSHKWVLPGGEYNADGTRIYPYLTVPEDARIGVCCHELGHLLFGWPDLYDIDGSSEGLGNWCLMAGGSWNGDGRIPAHPSAWCKAEQGWVTVANQTTNGPVSCRDVKETGSVIRLWKEGAASQEYFLMENRQRRNYDRLLPGDGLLLYHVDDRVGSNSDERHPKVRLIQADGARDLDRGANRGDAGDPFPGSTRRTTFSATTDPSSKSYGGVNTHVEVRDISPSGTVMTATVNVRQVVARPPVRPPRPRPRFPWWFRLFSPGSYMDDLINQGSGQMPGRFSLQDLIGSGLDAEQEGPGFAGEAAGMEELWMRTVEDRLATMERVIRSLHSQSVLLPTSAEPGQPGLPSDPYDTIDEALRRSQP